MSVIPGSDLLLWAVPILFHLLSSHMRLLEPKGPQRVSGPTPGMSGVDLKVCIEPAWAFSTLFLLLLQVRPWVTFQYPRVMSFRQAPPVSPTIWMVKMSAKLMPPPFPEPSCATRAS